jgi:hypothetical protein
MCPELRSKVTLATAVDAADSNKQTAGVGNVRPPLEDFTNYFFNTAHIL